MSTDTPDTSEAIKIALASAETASDAADLAETTANQLSAKADWVDRKLIPAGIGAMAAMTLCSALSALVYFKTLNDLRSVRDTHVEALHVFSQHVNDLSETIALTQDMISRQNTERGKLADALDTITARISSMEEQIAASSEVTMAALGSGPDGFAGQLARTMEPQIESIRGEVMGGMSDLHLAISQKLSALASQMKTAAVTTPQQNSTTFAEAKKTKTPVKPTTKPQARPTSASSTKKQDNPFSYP